MFGVGAPPDRGGGGRDCPPATRTGYRAPIAEPITEKLTEELKPRVEGVMSFILNCRVCDLDLSFTSNSFFFFPSLCYCLPYLLGSRGPIAGSNGDV